MSLLILHTANKCISPLATEITSCAPTYFFIFCCRSHQTYYMFGFLFLVYLILVVTCSEATILLCYFHLCAEVSSDPTLHRVEISTLK